MTYQEAYKELEMFLSLFPRKLSWQKVIYPSLLEAIEVSTEAVKKAAEEEEVMKLFFEKYGEEKNNSSKYCGNCKYNHFYKFISDGCDGAFMCFNEKSLQHLNVTGWNDRCNNWEKDNG